MSDLKIKKEQNINFRVEEDIKERIIELARRENLNLSAFMKKVVLEYPDLVEASRELEESNSIRYQTIKISQSLRAKLDSYKAIEFEKLFNSVRGKEYKGKQIRSESDLLKIFVQESNVKLKEDDKEIDLKVNDIVVEDEKKSKLNLYIIISLVVILMIIALAYFKKKGN